jgi:hypothetical protein
MQPTVTGWSKGPAGRLRIDFSAGDQSTHGFIQITPDTRMDRYGPNVIGSYRERGFEIVRIAMIPNVNEIVSMVTVNADGSTPPWQFYNSTPPDSYIEFDHQVWLETQLHDEERLPRVHVVGGTANLWLGSLDDDPEVEIISGWVQGDFSPERMISDILEADFVLAITTNGSPPSDAISMVKLHRKPLVVMGDTVELDGDQIVLDSITSMFRYVEAVA